MRSENSIQQFTNLMPRKCFRPLILIDDFCVVGNEIFRYDFLFKTFFRYKCQVGHFSNIFVVIHPFC